MQWGAAETLFESVCDGKGARAEMYDTKHIDIHILDIYAYIPW